MARIIGRLPHLHAAIRLAEAELCKIKRANKALNRPNRIVRADIVLNACRKQARLVPALAGLECMIRHKPNRTSTHENAEFLPSLDGQISRFPKTCLVAGKTMRRPRDEFSEIPKFRLPTDPNHFYISHRPVPKEGRAHVTNA